MNLKLVHFQFQNLTNRISNNMFCAMWLGSLELFGPTVLGDAFHIIVPIAKTWLIYLWTIAIRATSQN
jgi:hypothetical protein